MAQATAEGKRERATTRTGTLPMVARCAVGAGIGVLLALTFAPWGLSFGLLFGVAGLLMLVRGRSVREAWYIGLACGIAWFAVALHWLRDMFGPAALSLWALAGVFPSIFCALLTWLERRYGKNIPYPLLAGAVWTGVEVFRSEIMAPAFGWMGLGYALVERPLAMQVASIIGGYGVSFAVVALAAILANSVSGIRASSIRRRPDSIPLSAPLISPLFPLSLTIGAWLLLFAVPGRVPAAQQPVTARLIQANSEDEENLFGLSQIKPGEARPDVIVWPEYSFVSDPTRQPKLWAKLTDVPKQTGCWFLFGAKETNDPRDDANFRNTAFLMDASGNVVGRHVKNHTVPFIRDGQQGRIAQSFATPFGRVGVAICFDMDMPDVARQLTSNGAEVLLVPSDNPLEWGNAQHRQHAQVFQMRAAESGRWIATTDVAGNTFTVSPNGQVAQSIGTTEPGVITARIGREAGITPFVRGGWRFGRVCLALLFALSFWRIIAARTERVMRKRNAII